MKICELCNAEFPILVMIDGKKRNLGSRKFCLTCSPFGGKNTSKTPNNCYKSKIDRLSNDEFEILVGDSKSRSEIFRKLGLHVAGDSFKKLNKRINNLGLDISHFETPGFQEGQIPVSGLPIEYLLVENSIYQSNSLKKRLLKEGLLKNECSLCPTKDSWNGFPLVLQLDHINGNKSDNRLINLRLLCPNCHSQTPTFSRRNKI